MTQQTLEGRLRLTHDMQYASALAPDPARARRGVAQAGLREVVRWMAKEGSR
jgi:hypothetical protein